MDGLVDCGQGHGRRSFDALSRHGRVGSQQRSTAQRRHSNRDCIRVFFLRSVLNAGFVNIISGFELTSSRGVVETTDACASTQPSWNASCAQPATLLYRALP